MKAIEKRFWQLLEIIPSRTVCRPDWQRAMGPEYALFQGMIHPVDTLASVVTDPDDIDGRKLMVVDYGNGKYSAIDPATGDRRMPLTLDDIIGHAFDMTEFRTLLGRTLGFETVADAIPPKSLTPMRFGVCRIKPGMDFPVYLILAPDCRVMLERLRVLLISERNPFFLLTVTRRTWTQEMIQLISDRKSQLVALEECLGVDEGGFAKSATWDNAMNAFRRAHCPDDLVAAPAPYEFRRISGGWQIRFDEEEACIIDSKGAHYISLLLSKPDKPISAANMQAIGAGQDPEKVWNTGNAGTMSDEETVQKVGGELRTLLADLEEARRDGDTLVEQEVLAAMAPLEDYLRRVTDGNGNLRKDGDDYDGHRKSVSNAINRAINEIAKTAPNCGAHFRDNVHTGGEVSYESKKGISWTI